MTFDRIWATSSTVGRNKYPDLTLLLPSGSWESNREERLHSGDYDKSGPNGRAMPSWDSLPFGISGKDLQEGLPEFMLEAKLGFNRER